MKIILIVTWLTMHLYSVRNFWSTINVITENNCKKKTFKNPMKMSFVMLGRVFSRRGRLVRVKH